MADRELHAVFSYLKKKTNKPVGADENLFQAGLLDSMEVLELIHHLEQDLGIEVGPDDITEDNFKTAAAIAALAEARRA